MTESSLLLGSSTLYVLDIIATFYVYSYCIYVAVTKKTLSS